MMFTQLFTGVILCELKLEQFTNNVRLPHDEVDTQAAYINDNWHQTSSLCVCLVCQCQSAAAAADDKVANDAVLLGWSSRYHEC